jgi:hypothetical protein
MRSPNQIVVGLKCNVMKISDEQKIYIADLFFDWQLSGFLNFEKSGEQRLVVPFTKYGSKVFEADLVGKSNVAVDVDWKTMNRDLKLNKLLK